MFPIGFRFARYRMDERLCVTFFGLVIHVQCTDPANCRSRLFQVPPQTIFISGRLLANSKHSSNALFISRLFHLYVIFANVYVADRASEFELVRRITKGLVCGPTVGQPV